MRFNEGLPANFYFLRDSKGIEVDCIQESPDGARFIEIKSSSTFMPNHVKNMLQLKKKFLKPKIT